MAARDEPIKPADIAWPKEQRLKQMREVVAYMAKHGDLSWIKPSQYAATWGLSVATVEAEMMKHMQEGCDK